ncbi:sugar phosphate isomerase/epimerase [Oscillospiraceae bacterium OttesenSCG-928-F05]|nr:sugar phosphate isomerase/epimerase [Oscillospiraceae bacterium OttesenSCG-928-F05]
MQKSKIFIQAYSLLPFMVDGTMVDALKIAKDVGYEGVQFMAGAFYGQDAKKLRAELDAIGMQAVSTHLMAEPDDAMLTFCETLGLKSVHAELDHFEDRDGALRAAEKMNAMGKALKAHGMKYVYHNHTFEFGKADGKYLHEIMIENTDPDTVGFELDVGWATISGVDCAAYIKKHAGRFFTIHFKEATRNDVAEAMGEVMMELGKAAAAQGIDISKGFPEDIHVIAKIASKTIPASQWNGKLGEGIVDWKAVVDAAEAQGCVGYISEREYDYLGDMLGCIKEDYAFMASL